MDAITPYRTGHLSRNNKIREPEVSPGRLVIGMFNPVEYAAPVHENLAARHAPGTQAKFMEAPIARDLPIWPRMMVGITEDLIAKEVAKHGR